MESARSQRLIRRLCIPGGCEAQILVARRLEAYPSESGSIPHSVIGSTKDFGSFSRVSSTLGEAVTEAKVVEARGCDSRFSGFKSRQSPHLKESK